jgi:Cyanobacterial TRADD-N associated 2-Transmembrane domain
MLLLGRHSQEAPERPVELSLPEEELSFDSIVEGWFGSTERQRALTELIFLTAVSMGLGALAVVIVLNETLIHSESTRLVVALTVGFLSLVIYAFGLARIQGSKAKFREAQERRLQEEREQALEKLQDITDLATLLKLNRQQMDAYQTLSRDQAANSYAVSQIASVVGGVILLGGAVAVIAVPSVATKLSVAAIATLGGAFSGYVSRTFLRVYERTLIQLNFYFQQPLITSYVLAAERLIDKMRVRRRDSAYSAVIRDVLGITSRAAHAGMNSLNGASPAGEAPAAGAAEALRSGEASQRKPRFLRRLRSAG